jgi:hypothetical protein
LTLLSLTFWSARGHSGSERRNQQERRANVAGEHPVERTCLEVRGQAEERDPSVVDQNVDVADLACKTLHSGRVAEVGSDEARLAAAGGDVATVSAPRSG